VKRWGLPLFGLALSAAAFRLICYFVFRPVGVEPDGLGLAVLFWPAGHQPAEWAAQLLPRVAGYWPPAYPAANALVGRLLGDPFLAGRVVSALCAGLLVWVTALLVRRLTDSRAAGLFAGSLMACAPLAVAWDVRIRPETMFLAAYLAAVYFAVAYLQDRRGRDLALATLLSGAAALVKYDIIVFLPPLAVFWIAHLRGRQYRIVPWGALAAAGWLCSLIWLLTHEGARAGDYRQLLGGETLRQFFPWLGLTLAALPAVVTWPVAALAIWGGYSLVAPRTDRPAGALLLYLILAHLAVIAVGYNWISRYLLAALPFVVVLAGVGWHALPPLRGLKAVALGLSLAVCAVLAVVWVQAERDKWTETMEVGRAVANLPRDATVWTDDPYLTPYWARRDLRTLDDLNQARPGDYVVLHDLYGALRHKRLVETSLTQLESRGRTQILADRTTVAYPLSGDVLDFDAAELAHVRDLRALGPRPFWQRNQPHSIRSVLLRLTPPEGGRR